MGRYWENYFAIVLQIHRGSKTSQKTFCIKCNSTALSDSGKAKFSLRGHFRKIFIHSIHADSWSPLVSQNRLLTKLNHYLSWATLLPTWKFSTTVHCDEAFNLVLIMFSDKHVTNHRDRLRYCAWWRCSSKSTETPRFPSHCFSHCPHGI